MDVELDLRHVLEEVGGVGRRVDGHRSGGS
jgi:hypothetical protein